MPQIGERAVYWGSMNDPKAAFVLASYGTPPAETVDLYVFAADPSFPDGLHTDIPWAGQNVQMEQQAGGIYSVFDPPAPVNDALYHTVDGQTWVLQTNNCEPGCVPDEGQLPPLPNAAYPAGSFVSVPCCASP